MALIEKNLDRMGKIEQKLDNLEEKSRSRSPLNKHKRGTKFSDSESDFLEHQSSNSNTSEVVENYQQIDNLEWLLKRSLET